MQTNTMTRILLSFLSFVFFTFVYLSMAYASVRIESDNFVLSGDIEASDGIEMLSELERFRSALLAIHNVDFQTPDQAVDIYIVSDPEIFQVLGVGDKFVAIYQPTMAGPIALINGQALKDDPKQLRESLLHEYVHHFNVIHHTELLPRWLNEGLAEYYSSYQEISDAEYQIGLPRPDQVFLMTYPQKAWMSYYDIFASFTDIKPKSKFVSLNMKEYREWPVTPSDTELFYIQTWGLIHYMMNQEGGIDKLVDLSKEIQAIIGGYSETDYAEPPEPTNGFRANIFQHEIEAASQRILGFSNETLKKAVFDYTQEEVVPFQTHKVSTERLTSSVSVQNLTDIEAKGAQYRLLTLSAESVSINPTMKAMKAELEGAPDMEKSLLISNAIEQYRLGWNVKAMELIQLALETTPDDTYAQRLKAHFEFQRYSNENFQNPLILRDALRPVLERTPNDPYLLVQMVLTGLEVDDVSDPEVDAALIRLKQTQAFEKHPLTVLPLVNYYLFREDFEMALTIARRALAFSGRDKYQINGMISELETYQAEALSSTKHH